MTVQSISQITYRRYILGKQGLWPARRWSGKTGTAQALLNNEMLQVDPVSVIAHSHDIALWGRVIDYQPGYLDHYLYSERQFFDYGGNLWIYPIGEFPYLRLFMEYWRTHGHWADYARENPGLLDYVRGEIRARGPLRKSDLGGNRVAAYRASRDTGLALHCLWMQGELMTHSRRGIVRYYDLTERILPDSMNWAAPEGEARDYLVRKAIRLDGMVHERKLRLILQDVFRRPVDKKEAHQHLQGYLESKYLEPVEVEGKKEPCYFPAADVTIVDALQNGAIPESWLQKQDSHGVVFLSPLEYVSARGRAKELFGVEYTWEIYKPAALRQYGPYTMPILYGDRIVARMDSRHDRKNKTLVIQGFWMEEWFIPDDGFGAGFNRCMADFLRFLQATHVDTSTLSTDKTKNFMATWLDPEATS